MDQLSFSADILFLQFPQIIVHAIESPALQTAERINPSIQLIERLGSKLVDTPVGAWMHLNEPGIAKNTKMFGNLRLVEPKSFGYFTHCKGSVPQELDNV
ncbi:hypothetical protein SD71_03140 [Cohnella kolymensis]|uniref:Uncharacterized protein n=1 Tax=Cohnella kolymensis TaxID=1590652 RepID=A0ABR5A9D5_9BACL|nr:hypothetical protein SD71_03140 [Cohnella kolymensis]